MTENSPSPRGRRRLLRGIAATGLGSALAGCLGGGSDGGGTDSETTPTSGGGTTASTPGSATATATSSEPTGGSPSGSVTADVTLTVRSSRSNVDQFGTLQTTFEALELDSTDGNTVRMDSTTMDIDLTSVGPGGTVDLFETSLPAGSYEEARLYLPIQNATLANGDDPEFERTVPASRQVRQGDPIEFQSGSSIDLGLTIALLRIAGDGPWTYTLGWGIQ